MKKIPEDLKRLGERIEELQQYENAAKHDKADSDFVHATKAGLRIGTELLSGVLVGAATGYTLDYVFDSNPFLLIVFLFIGGAAGILNVYRFAKSEENKRSI